MVASLGLTVRQWDTLPSSERAWWQARHEREQQRCTCGNPRAKCHDPDRDWFPQLTVCRATMEREAAQAKFARLHEKEPWHDGTFTRWSARASNATPFHHSHGTSIWVSDVDHNFGGDFLLQGGGSDGAASVSDGVEGAAE